MREMDFTEKNLFSRLCGVNTFWTQLQGEVIRKVKRYVERAMGEEVTRYLCRGRYERVGRPTGHRNGRYARWLLTTYGWIENLLVPRVREGGFESSVFAKYRRRCRVIDQVVLEAFLLGHATRKVRRWFRRLFGAAISAQAVSNIVHELDDEVKRFHGRRLHDRYRFLYLDGFWITLRTPVKMKKVVLVASSESASWWWGFVSDLKSRGLSGAHLEVVITDGAPGLIQAVRGLYPRAAHQRCTFHKCSDLAGHVVDTGRGQRLVTDALHIFEADTESEVRSRLRQLTARWSETEPKAMRLFRKDIDACLVYLNYPDPLCTRLKTTNPIERYIEEVRRRTNPMRSFNNLKSAERIVYGLIAYVLNQYQDMPVNAPLPEFTQNP